MVCEQFVSSLHGCGANRQGTQCEHKQITRCEAGPGPQPPQQQQRLQQQGIHVLAPTCRPSGKTAPWPRPQSPWQPASCPRLRGSYKGAGGERGSARCSGLCTKPVTARHAHKPTERACRTALRTCAAAWPAIQCNSGTRPDPPIRQPTCLATPAMAGQSGGGSWESNAKVAKMQTQNLQDAGTKSTTNAGTKARTRVSLQQDSLGRLGVQLGVLLRVFQELRATKGACTHNNRLPTTTTEQAVGVDQPASLERLLWGSRGPLGRRRSHQRQHQNEQRQSVPWGAVGANMGPRTPWEPPSRPAPEPRPGVRSAPLALPRPRGSCCTTPALRTPLGKEQRLLGACSPPPLASSR